MTWRWLRILVLTAGVALAGTSCKHGDPTPTNTSPPPPAVTGEVDCAGAAVWTTTTFASLIPPVQRAVAQSDPQGALNQLLQTHSNGEVACVVGYVHDQSVQQAASAPSDPLPGQRVAATQTWLDQQSQHGLTLKARSATAGTATTTATTADQNKEAH
jgi:hypothetical protein